ncbi:MAG: hypothetical protein HYU67_02370 [Flavobacteriia bacterium]|nr:hypothetical protein [Flavobacteriia bacterium]
MKNKIIILLLFCIFIPFVHSQNRDTIQLFKDKKQVFKGVQEEIKNWYIYINGDKLLLSEIHEEENEIKSWFEKRCDSQNLFQHIGYFRQNDTLFLKKANDSETIIPLILHKINKDSLVVYQTDLKEQYYFKKIFDGE